MNEEILIDLGVVSEETLGFDGEFVEGTGGCTTIDEELGQCQ